MLVLTLLRHGEAAPSGADGDSGRRLTARGEAAIRGLAARLEREGWRPDRTFSSPLRRALQTASIMLRHVGVDGPAVTLQSLEPEIDPEGLLAALAGLGVTGGEVLLVGHQPQLGLVCTHLTGRECSLRPGEMVSIQLPGALHAGAGTITRTLAPGLAG